MIADKLRTLADEAKARGVPLTMTPEEARAIADAADELAAAIAARLRVSEDNYAVLLERWKDEQRARRAGEARLHLCETQLAGEEAIRNAALERAATAEKAVAAHEQAAYDVYWNYHPDYFPKLPLCVQTVWRNGAFVAKARGQVRAQESGS